MDPGPGRYLPASRLGQGEKQAGQEQEASYGDDQPGSPRLTQGGLPQTMSKRSVLTCRNGTPTAVSAFSMASIMAEEIGHAFAQLRQLVAEHRVVPGRNRRLIGTSVSLVEQHLNVIVVLSSSLQNQRLAPNGVRNIESRTGTATDGPGRCFHSSGSGSSRSLPARPTRHPSWEGPARQGRPDDPWGARQRVR
jgi:hypothetical protein